MSDENNELYTVELTEDEIDQCVHALNKWCEVLVREGYSLELIETRGFFNTIKKLDSVFTRPPIGTGTDRFAMGTPGVAHAGENKDSDS